jgi:hypothetical protein
MNPDIVGGKTRPTIHLAALFRPTGERKVQHDELVFTLINAGRSQSLYRNGHAG